MCESCARRCLIVLLLIETHHDGIVSSIYFCRTGDDDALYSILSSGDFCTLIRAGYSTRQAIMAQLFTAVAAFAGTATAIVVSEEAWAEERLLWVTAGGFLYLAATTILPDVLAEGGGGDGENSTATSRRLFRLAQLAAFCAGISCLYMVDVFGGDHYHHSHQGHNDDHNHNHGHHDHHHEATVGSIHEQHAEL